MEKDFSRNDFDAMSEKAIRNLREMQRQAKVKNSCPPAVKCFEKNDEKKKEKPELLPPKKGKEQEKEKEKANGKFNPLSMLMSADRDTLLIMSLILLLIGDCNDELLIFALIYIIM